MWDLVQTIKRHQSYPLILCWEAQFKSQEDLQWNRLVGHLKVRQTESLCFLSLVEGVSEETADIPAVRWVESLRELGKCFSHTQVLNLTYFNRVAAISHRELITDTHASCVMTTVFISCYVKLNQHYLSVLMSDLASIESYICHELIAGVWHHVTPWWENPDSGTSLTVYL